MSKVPPGREFAENVRRAVEQMKALQESARRFEELSREYPKLAARFALNFAIEEVARLRRMLKERFGLVVR